MKTLHQIQTSNPLWFLSARDKIALVLEHDSSMRFAYREPSEENIESATLSGTVATRIHWMWEYPQYNTYESIWESTLVSSYNMAIERGVTVNDFDPRWFVEIDPNLTRR